MSRNLSRLIYVDDSGFDRSGIAVYGWVECHPSRWAGVLAAWLSTRKRLWRDYGVPIPAELHATDYVNGRGRVSTRVPDAYRRDGVALWKDLGRDIARECLETLRSVEGLRVGAVYRRGDPAAFHAVKRATYEALVQRWERQLHAEDALALVFIDGDGSDLSYRSTHRSLRLEDRRVLEDAIHVDSRASQWVQMADLVAWTAYASVERFPGHSFAWHWYRDFLSERDPMRAPLRVEGGNSETP